MASITSGASGSTMGLNRFTISPVGDTRNFSKFHWMSPASPSRVGERDQLLVDRVAAVAVDLDLLEHRERDAVGGRAEGGDLLGGPGLLGAELIAGEAEDGESLVAVGLLQALEPLVLGCQPAFRGHVDDQQRLAAVVGDRGRFTGEGVEWWVVDAHGHQV